MKHFEGRPGTLRLALGTASAVALVADVSDVPR